MHISNSSITVPGNLLIQYFCFGIFAFKIATYNSSYMRGHHWTRAGYCIELWVMSHVGCATRDKAAPPRFYLLIILCPIAIKKRRLLTFETLH